MTTPPAESARGRHGLRLGIEDALDLEIVSAHVQDAVVRVRELAFQPRQRRFTLLMNRFVWDDATRKWRFLSPYRRARSGLSFEDVSSVKIRGIDQSRGNDLLVLLAATFEPVELPPAGTIRLAFAGSAEIRLGVDCLDGRLVDLGPAWATLHRPRHDDRAR